MRAVYLKLQSQNYETNLKNQISNIRTRKIVLLVFAVLYVIPSVATYYINKEMT